MSFKPVMGIDPSPTATGVSVIYAGNDKAVGDTICHLESHFGKSMSKEEWANPAFVAEMWKFNVDAIRRWILEFSVVEVAIEGHAFSRFPNNRLVEYIGALKWALWYDNDTPECLKNIWVVQPNAARSYMAKAADLRPPKVNEGEKKKTVKEMVDLHLRSKGIEISDHNERDAFVIANWLWGKINGNDSAPVCALPRKLL